MFKYTVEYEDFNGNKKMRDLYFNLTKMELYELNKKYNYQEYLKDITKKQDDNKIYSVFKEIVLSSYGEVDDKTGKFIKNEEIRNCFEHSEEYSQFFMNIIEDVNNNNKNDIIKSFMIGIVPKEVGEKMKKENFNDKIGIININENTK